MGESFKAICVVLLVVACGVAVVVWSDDRPDATTWTLRLGTTALAMVLLAVLLRLHFRKDVLPDYLRALAGTYFNCNGFCIALDATDVEGVCHLRVHFQNQYDRSCRGKIVLRPARGFWMTRADVDMIACEIDCGPAAFGVASIPVALPLEIQGASQVFEVEASVTFEPGRRRRLRFYDGMHLRRTSRCFNVFAIVVTLAGAMSGHGTDVMWTSPAKTTLSLPTNVAEYLRDVACSEITILWSLGDPPLDQV